MTNELISDKLSNVLIQKMQRVIPDVECTNRRYSLYNSVNPSYQMCSSGLIETTCKGGISISCMTFI